MTFPVSVVDQTLAGNTRLLMMIARSIKKENLFLNYWLFNYITCFAEFKALCYTMLSSRQCVIRCFKFISSSIKFTWIWPLVVYVLALAQYGITIGEAEPDGSLAHAREVIMKLVLSF